MPAPRQTSWPYVIILAFVLFASYIGFMVSRAMRTSVELVSPDYYQQELRYQQRLESMARTQALPAPVQLQYQREAQRLSLQLPAALAGQAVRGQLHFFRPSAQQLDFTLPFRPVGTPARQELSTARLAAGHWRLRIDFTADEQPYYLEKELSI